MFVVLPWSNYHNLLSSGDARIFETLEQASRFVEGAPPQDKIIGPLTESDADELKTAFNTLCAAAWTPNQTTEERNANALLISQAKATIDRFSE